ncbi:MAG: 16S rRNA (guanine(966)-N(2))-methyltransferase RsmD [Thermodesulfobacteriota bacterium]
MRVISGICKGRKLASPAGSQTRPTADRVKEAVFNILGQQFYDVKVLDLFSGTGALAIEALSRGASSAVIVDVSEKAIAVIRKNVASCGFETKTRIVRWNILQNLNCLDPQIDGFDLVFIDPPYGKGMAAPTLNRLVQKGVLRDHAIVVVEYAAVETLPDTVGNLIQEDMRTYGRTAVRFYRWLEPANR